MQSHTIARTISLVLLLGGTAACRDSPTPPDESELRLEMRRGTIPFEEETIAPGATLQLEATFINTAGTAQGAGSVDWSTTDPAVATVDGSGRVTGSQVGTAKVIVAAGAQADTGIVNVATAVTGELSCAAGDPDLTLGVGDVRLLAGEATVDVCLPGGLGGADYLLVPFNASLDAGARLDTRVVASASIAPLPTVSRSISPVQPFVHQREALPDDEFHMRHLRLSHAELEPALQSSTAAQAIAPRATPTVGQLLRLNAATRSSSGCSNPDYRTGRVVAISDRAVIVADTANPKNGFSTADYTSIGATFDDLIWQVDTSHFGDPTDIDETGRVMIFYTRAVNELTPSGSGSYVGGFFYNRDLFPTTGSSACAGSNEAEMFYMLVPDPDGVVNGNVRSTNFVLERTYSVLAHEFQHLINDSRRLYVNDATVWEDDWLNEGLSHIAEELAFYAASGHTPRQNLGSTPITGEAARTFDRYNLDNVERYIRYLRVPEDHSLMGNVDELATRGAIWAFLRYAADREPGDDAAMWRRLVNSTSRGLENLEDVTGANPRDWMHDWEVSVYTDDAGFAIAEPYTQPSWNFRVLTPVLDPSGRFPLRVTGLSPTSPSILLEGGAAVFYQMRVQAGARRAVRTTVDQLPPPSRLRLAVVRIR